MDRAILPLSAARMRCARQTGHDRLRQRLAAGRRPGSFRAIRGLFPVALGGLRRDGLRSHDGGLHCGTEDIANFSIVSREKCCCRRAGAHLGARTKIKPKR